MMGDDASALYRVGVVGLGYIGLPTAALLAASGHRVIGVDKNPAVVATISDGGIHIEEPGLEAMVADAISSGRLTAALSPEPCDVFLIAVPTPFREDLTPDVSLVLEAAAALAPVVEPGNLVIVESTCPIGTTQEVHERIARLRPELFAAESGVHVAYCPERVLPGRIIEELIANDRCIGGLTPEATSAAQDFYRSFVRGDCIGTTARTAEMVKLVENASRDVGIAFANELSLIAERMQVDVWEVIALANRHPRVSILQPGPGVGGHCIAVDPWFLVAAAPAEARLIRTAREVNDAKPEFVLERAEALLAAHPGARLACLGLAFKPDIDDLRESPALYIVEALARRHRDRIVCVEPHIRSLPPGLRQAGAELQGWDAAVERCALGLLLVDHSEFRVRGTAPPFAAYIDTRGLWRSPEDQPAGR